MGDREIYQRARKCETKRRYETREVAAIGNWDVYRCEHCEGFHRATPVVVKALSAVRGARSDAVKPKAPRGGTLPRSITMRPIRATWKQRGLPDPCAPKIKAEHVESPPGRLFKSSIAILLGREIEENGINEWMRP